MTLQLTPALEQRLEHLAEQTQRTSSELAQEAIDLYLQHIELLMSEVRDAEEEADRQGWLTTDEVFARLRLRKTA